MQVRRLGCAAACMTAVFRALAQQGCLTTARAPWVSDAWACRAPHHRSRSPLKLAESGSRFLTLPKLSLLCCPSYAGPLPCQGHAQLARGWLPARPHAAHVWHGTCLVCAAFHWAAVRAAGRVEDGHRGRWATCVTSPCQRVARQVAAALLHVAARGSFEPWLRCGVQVGLGWHETGSLHHLPLCVLHGESTRLRFAWRHPPILPNPAPPAHPPP